MKENVSSVPIDLILESSGGGSGQHMLDLFHGLCRRGRDVRMIVSLRQGKEGRTEDSFLEAFERIDSGFKKRLDLRRSPHPSDIAAILKLRGDLKSHNRPRLLHAHSTKAGMIAAALRVDTAATIFTPHAYRSMDPRLTGFRKAVVTAAERLINSGQDRIIAVSQDEMDYAVANGVHRDRIRYIPNGVDIDALAKAAGGTRGAYDPNRPVIGFVGRMTGQKNPIAFLELFDRVHRRFPQARAIMLGGGPMMPEVQAFIASKPWASSIETPGHVPALPRLNEMDLMAHTSHYESLPYALLEANAVGLPVVAVRNAGTRAVFGEHEDLVADPDDVDALAAATFRLLEDPRRMAAARQRGAEAAQRFSLEAMIDATERVYQEALASRERA